MLTRRVLLGPGAVASFLVPALARADRSPPRAADAPPLVVLDPGHGGKDPGAIGITGTYEKHVAFAAAQQLRQALTADRRYRVELTRTRDEFIALEDRVAIAQRRGGALFVSMHADAIADPGIRGASVYTLAEQASDSQTAALARRENDADRYAGPSFHGTSPDVARILASLVRQETRLGSARLARGMVGSLGHDVTLLQNPARRASFAVLRSADIPSVLVEMGFMSNRDDEAALRRADHRGVVVTAMRRAIDGWFAQLHPSPDLRRAAG